MNRYRRAELGERIGAIACGALVFVILLSCAILLGGAALMFIASGGEVHP